MSDHFTTLRSKGLKSHQIYMKVLKTNLADFSFSSWFQAKFTFNIRQCSTAYLNYVPPPCSLKSPGNHYFKIVVFFRISVFAKWSILELWKGSEYTKDYCCKILAEYLLMSTGKCWNKYSHSGWRRIFTE